MSLLWTVVVRGTGFLSEDDFHHHKSTEPQSTKRHSQGTSTVLPAYGPLALAAIVNNSLIKTFTEDFLSVL